MLEPALRFDSFVVPQPCLLQHIRQNLESLWRQRVAVASSSAPIQVLEHAGVESTYSPPNQNYRHSEILVRLRT
jgi:hypothetical protein